MNTIAKILILFLLLAAAACRGKSDNNNDNYNDDNHATMATDTPSVDSSLDNGSSTSLAAWDTTLGKKKITREGNHIKTEIKKPDGLTVTVTETELPYYISGKIVGGAGGNVVIDDMGIGIFKPLAAQTVNPEEQYDFSGTLSEPALLQLRLPAGRIHLIVYPGDTITVASYLAHPENFTSGGSPETIRLNKMYDILEHANAEKDKITNALDSEKDKSKLPAMYAAEPAQLNHIDAIKRLNLEKFIDENDTSFVNILAALYLSPETNFDYIAKVVQEFAYKWPNSSFYNALYKKYLAYLPLQIGHDAPEILSKTPDGKNFRLSSLKGKYVLLDFWASWCAPCKQQFPILKELYHKYKNKNFVILSVSADEKKDAWLKALKQDSLPWPQVSDVMGFKSGNIQTYLVSSLPTNYLISPDGKIIGRHLDMPTLRNKLGSLLGNH